MKRLLLISFVSASVSLFSAVERRINLDPAPTAMHEAVAKKCYDQAKAGVENGKLTGTIADFYRKIKHEGYQKFLDEHSDVEQRAIEILDIFKESVADQHPLIKAAVEAYKAAIADPQNVDGWLQELEFFSEALFDLAKDTIDAEDFKPRLGIVQRLVENNGVVIEPKKRIEILAFLVVVTARFSDRYVAMGEENFKIFMARAPEVFARLAQKTSGEQITLKSLV